MSIKKLSGILAILPIDSFTGRPVTAKDFTVTLNGAPWILKKPDGFYIFDNALPPAPQDTADICIRLCGNGYQETTVTTTTDAVDHKHPVILVRVNPDCSHPFPPETVFLKGTLGMGVRLSAALIQKERALHLARDYNAGEDYIAIYQTVYRDLAQSALYITDMDAAAGIWIWLKSADTSVSLRRSMYLLEDSMPQDWQKTSACLYPAVVQNVSNVDNTATARPYCFAFRCIPQKGGICEAKIVCRATCGDKSAAYEFAVTAGKTILKDFIAEDG